MTKEAGELFRREIEKRLQSSEWSSLIASSVIAKSRGSSAPMIKRITSTIITLTGAAAIFCVIIYSSHLKGPNYSGPVELYSENNDFTGIGTNEVDSMINYVYYGRE